MFNSSKNLSVITATGLIFSSIVSTLSMEAVSSNNQTNNQTNKKENVNSDSKANKEKIQELHSTRSWFNKKVISVFCYSAIVSGLLTKPAKDVLVKNTNTKGSNIENDDSKESWKKDKQELLDEIQDLKNLIEKQAEYAKKIANDSSGRYSVGDYIVVVLRVAVLSIVLSALIFLAYIAYKEYKIYKKEGGIMNYVYNKVLDKEGAENLKKEIKQFNDLSKEENGGIMNYIYNKVLDKEGAKNLKKEIEQFNDLSKEENDGIMNYVYNKVLGEEGAKNLKEKISQFNNLSKEEKGGIMNYVYNIVLGKDGAENLKKEIKKFSELNKGGDSDVLKYLCSLSGNKKLFKNVEKLLNQVYNISELFNRTNANMGNDKIDDKGLLFQNILYFMNLAKRLQIASHRIGKYNNKCSATAWNGYNLPYIIPCLNFALGGSENQNDDAIYKYLIEGDVVKPKDMYPENLVPPDLLNNSQ